MMAMAAVSALLIGIGEIYVIGVDGDRLKETETLHLLGETAALFAVLFLTLSLMSGIQAPIGILGIILPIYTIIDMIETAENVWSDSCVCAMVDKSLSEGEVSSEKS